MGINGSSAAPTLLWLTLLAAGCWVPPDQLDCDDTNPDVHPGADELPYNGIDDDCDPNTLDDDLDGDGYGIADDCDDTDATIHPGQAEDSYNGVDDDCDPSSPDDDLDGDGIGIADDCDDSDAAIGPDQAEDPYNGVDDDCDPDTPDDDLDGDGVGIADDCDDLDGTIFPGADDPPGDCLDQDCSADWEAEVAGECGPFFNEAMIDPGGVDDGEADGECPNDGIRTDQCGEWIELVHAGSTPVEFLPSPTASQTWSLVQTRNTGEQVEQSLYCPQVVTLEKGDVLLVLFIYLTEKNEPGGSQWNERVGQMLELFGDSTLPYCTVGRDSSYSRGLVLSNSVDTLLTLELGGRPIDSVTFHWEAVVAGTSIELNPCIVHDELSRACQDNDESDHWASSESWNTPDDLFLYCASDKDAPFMLGSPGTLLQATDCDDTGL